MMLVKVRSKKKYQYTEHRIDSYRWRGVVGLFVGLLVTTVNYAKWLNRSRWPLGCKLGLTQGTNALDP